MQHTISVNDLADMIIGLTSSRSRVIHLPMREGEDEDVAVDYIDVYKGTGVQRTSLHHGLEQTVEYYRNISNSEISSTLAFYYGDSDKPKPDSLTLQAKGVMGSGAIKRFSPVPAPALSPNAVVSYF